MVVGAVTLCRGRCLVGLGHATGYTKRKAMEKMDQRKQDRINKHKEALGMKTRRPR